MTYSEIVNRVSVSTGLPVEVIDKAYKGFWLYVKNSAQDQPLKKEITEEEFLRLRPNFNIPSLGKLTCTYDRYVGVKKRLQHIKNIREKNEKVT